MLDTLPSAFTGGSLSMIVQHRLLGQGALTSPQSAFSYRLQLNAVEITDGSIWHTVYAMLSGPLSPSGKNMERDWKRWGRRSACSKKEY